MTHATLEGEPRTRAPIDAPDPCKPTPGHGSDLCEPVSPADHAVTDLHAVLRRLVDESELNLRFSMAHSVEAITAVLMAIRDVTRDLSPRTTSSADLTATGGTAANESMLISHISLLEDIKSAAAAAQARATHAFIHARTAREREAGVPLAKRGRGIGSEIALARRQSPRAGSQATRMAYTLCEQMPHALAALNDGRLSEFATTVVVKEVSALSAPAQSIIDGQMKDRYGHAGPRRLAGEVRALANQADPVAQVKRRQIAVGERRVTVRPAPDSMAYLTALLPIEQAFACKKALLDAAATATYGEDEVTRSGSQWEADLLVERLTGQATAQAIPVELNIVMTDVSVFGTSRREFTNSATDKPARHGSRDMAFTPDIACIPDACVDDDGRLAEAVHASAWVPGLGPIPAPIARDLLHPDHDPPRGHDRHPDPGPQIQRDQSRVFLRRVLTDPVTGDITAMDTRRRTFTGALRRALLLRDDHCRTPWCEAPIVHLDHLHPYALGGETNATNGTGLCARCNYTKEYTGWEHTAQAESSRTVRTPTGHRYQSLRPPLVPELTVTQGA